VTVTDRGFAAVMAAAETVADFSLLVDFCLYASAMAMVAPLAAIAIMPGAGRASSIVRSVSARRSEVTTH
jgi:hypothetical protein